MLEMKSSQSSPASATDIVKLAYIKARLLLSLPVQYKEGATGAIFSEVGVWCEVVCLQAARTNDVHATVTVMSVKATSLSYIC